MWPTHEAKEQLGEQEDKHAAKDQHGNASTKRIASKGGGGSAPNNARDKLSWEPAEKYSAYISLSVGYLHMPHMSLK
jgi:hypothetical protein